MKIRSRLLALALCSASSAFAAITSISDPTGGTYVEQQGFTFNGSTITWSLHLPQSTGFFVQSFSEFSTIYLDFGEWNGEPFEVTSSPLGSAESVKNATAYQGQQNLFGADATFTNRYYGIRYGVGGGAFHYGWINLSTNAGGALINGAAFNTVVEDDIQTGQTTAIPEPSSYAACMALAASATALGRRRRATART